METTEIIAELRKVVAVGDSPVFCGGSFIPKLVAMEAADTLERQKGRLRELSELVLRQGDEIADLRKDIAVLTEELTAAREKLSWLEPMRTPNDWGEYPPEFPREGM